MTWLVTFSRIRSTHKLHIFKCVAATGLRPDSWSGEEEEEEDKRLLLKFWSSGEKRVY